MDILIIEPSLEKIEAFCIERNLKPTASQIIDTLFDMHGMTEYVTAGIMYFSHDIDALVAKLAEVK